MGRPLKITKAQAVITITNTTATTNLVTTNGNFTTLGIIAGMSFIPHTNIGNLVAGTQYWILKVVNAGNNSTFTVSATQLSANPTYAQFVLGTAASTVKASVEVVDAYFNNPVSGAGYPVTNTSTYSVVGGNTNIYGNQVLAQVAIGISGQGTIFSSTASADVYGAGTDFTTQLSTGSAIQIVNQQTGNPVNIGFVSSIGGYITEAVTSTTATGDFVVTSTGDFTNLVADQPVTFDANIGGLTTGTTYFVLSGANTTHMQVSRKLGGTAVELTNETATANATQDVFTMSAVALANSTFNTNPMTSWVYANDEAGFIVRQKGKQKYLVKGNTSGLMAQCYTANVANTALTPNTFNVLATYANAATQRVQSLSDHTGELFTATSGPIATGSIVFANAAPVYVTLNSAVAANAAAGRPYPLVQIASA